MTKTAARLSWSDANQACLGAEFARLKARLQSGSDAGSLEEGSQKESRKIRAAMDPPPAIDQLCDLFGLTAFERDVLLLAAGMEMDSDVAAQCRRLQGHTHRATLTFGLAMTALAEPHWSALTPFRPLRHFRMVELEAGQGLAAAPLRIDERVLHYLAGVNLPDARLQPLIEATPFPDWIAEEHKAVAGQAVRVFAADSAPAPVFHLCGDDPQGQEDVAALTAAAAEKQLFTVKPEDLPPAGADLEQFILLFEREVRLLPGALLIQCGSGALTASACHLAERLPGLVIVASREPIHLERPLLRFDVGKPLPAAQRRIWEHALGPAAAACSGTLDDLSAQFRLSARVIHSTGSLVNSEKTGIAAADLWNVCRSLSRPRLENMAQRLVPAVGWDDLVLPDAQLQALRHLALQVRHRMKVYETWGFSSKGRRGLGVSALFAGESGTGKTLAAEVLAHELALDLYRIDLSAVVSKYIGETEKNLKQVFDAAEEGGVLLLFDEADALFGKRGEIRDSRDRYANVEVGYLLQRMEAYQGLAILTTNLKSSMDRAFQRRLRVTIGFPFPDLVQREAIWRQVFPAATPTRNLDPGKLAHLNVAGGSIHNIALNAAFLAAASGQPVEMSHLLEAARLEGHKIERPLSEAETRGWV